MSAGTRGGGVGVVLSGTVVAKLPLRSDQGWVEVCTTNGLVNVEVASRQFRGCPISQYPQEKEALIVLAYRRIQSQRWRGS